MTQSPSDLPSLDRQLIEVYGHLTSLEKTIVQLFAVIFEPISRANFVTCWNSLSEKNRHGEQFTTATLKPYIDRLTDAGVLVQFGGGGPQCHPLLTEVATRDAVRAKQFEPFVKAAEQGAPLLQRWKDGPTSFKDERQLIRMVRIGIYRNDVKFIDKQLDDYYRYSYQRRHITLDEIYVKICNNPFDPDWFRTLRPELFDSALVSILKDSMLELTNADGAFSLLQAEAHNPNSSLLHIVLLVEQLLMRGKGQEASQLLEQLPPVQQNQVAILRGHVAIFQGDEKTAIAHYTTALASLKKNSGKRKIYFQSLSGLFFILALLKDGSPECLREAAEHTAIARQAKHWLSPTYAFLEHVIKLQQGELSKKALVLNTPIASHKAGNSIETLICALGIYWVDLDYARQHLPRLLEPLYDDAEAVGYRWIAKSSVDLLARLKPRSPKVKQAAALRADDGVQVLTDVIQPKEPWELCLNALAGLQKVQPQAVAKSETPLRLAWTIMFYPTGCSLQPREQSLNAKGEWSKGRPIALKRLKSDTSSFSYLTPQDLRVCAQIKVYSHSWGNKTEYVFGEKAIADLVGHPHVFWEDAPTIRVEIVKGEPELLVKKGKDDQLTLQFLPDIKDNRDILTVKESPTRLKVIEITPEHRRIAEILGQKNRLEVPAAAKERVLSAINAVSGIVTVQSDIGGGVATEEVSADPKPHIHLLPASTGLKVAVLSRPFANGGSYYQPGQAVKP